MNLPMPCQLQPEPEDVRFICEMYELTPRDWTQLVSDEWRRIRAMVRPEFTVPGRVPQSFNMLPYFRAHALYSPSAKHRQCANYAIADIQHPYFSD